MIVTPYTHVPLQEKDDPKVAALKLKPRRCYCGPYALSVVGGLNCYDTNELIKRSLRLSRRIGAMGYYDMEKVTRGSLFPTIPALKFVKMKSGPNLRNLGDHLKPRRLYIVGVGNHYVTINSSTLEVCDTFSRKWVHVNEHPYGRSFVTKFAEARVLEINREALNAEGVNHESNIELPTADAMVG